MAMLGRAIPPDAPGWHPDRLARALRRKQRSRRVVFALFEMTVAIVVVLIVWFYRSGNPERFLTMNPHPLLLVVAAISLRYGNYLGILAASLASLALGLTYHELGRDLVVFFTQWEHYKFLLMFYLAAVFLGMHKDRVDGVREDLTHDLEQSQADLSFARQSWEQMHIAYNELKRQIVGAEESLVALHDLAKAFDSLDTEEIYTECAAMIMRFIGRCNVHVYLVEPERGFVRLKLNTDHRGDESKSLRVSEHAWLTHTVTRQAHFKADSAGPQVPIMATPICVHGQVMAVVAIHAVSFYAATEYNYAIFNLIGDWVERAINRAAALAPLAPELGASCQRGACSATHWEKRVLQEERRMNKYDQPFCILQAKVDPANLEQVAGELASCLRQVDAVGYDQAAGVVKILLPLTNQLEASVVIERIKRQTGLEVSAEGVGDA